MRSNYGRDPFPWGTIALIGISANLVFQGGVALGKHNADADDRVREAQQHNAQLTEQLAEEYPSLSGLTIKDGDNKTFVFHMRDAQGVAETCRGEYELKADTATAVGSIACTQTHKIS